MVQQGAKAIVVYPISPTALNEAVKNACDKGVMIVAYDGEITEPCAYNTHIDQEEPARVTAEWLAKKLNGKGNIVMITGVPGTSVDTLRTKAAKEVFAKYPDIKIVGRSGRHVEPGGRAHRAVEDHRHASLGPDRRPVDAGRLLYRQHRCRSKPARSRIKLKPCAGEGSNGHRIQMLPVGTKVEGANGTYRRWARRASPTPRRSIPAAYALKMAVEKLDGKDVPKLTTLPLPIVTNDTVKLVREGHVGGDESRLQHVPAVPRHQPRLVCLGLLAEMPEIGLQAALVGQPEQLIVARGASRLRRAPFAAVAARSSRESS